MEVCSPESLISLSILLPLLSQSLMILNLLIFVLLLLRNCISCGQSADHRCIRNCYWRAWYVFHFGFEILDYICNVFFLQHCNVVFVADLLFNIDDNF